MPDSQEKPTKNFIETDGGTVVIGAVEVNGGEFIGRDKIEYHWHINEVSERVKLLSSRLISECSTMTFVDLVRLFEVSSGDLAYRYNINRYEEFLDVANDHYRSLNSQLEKFTYAMSIDAISSSERIKRQCEWVLRILKDKPSEPIIRPRLVKTLQRLSRDIHQFCIASQSEEYLSDFGFVAREVSGKRENFFRPNKEINFDDIGIFRLSSQSKLLDSYQKGNDPLHSIGEDALFEFAFIYFALDYLILNSFKVV